MKTVIEGNRLIKFNDAAELYVVPQHIEFIEDLAFADSDRLTELSMTDSVKEIGSYAFANCYALRDITMPQSVRRIGAGLFQKCWSIRKVAFPEGLVILGGEMFEGCHALTTLCLPSTLESVERTAFSTCRNLRYIYIDPEKIGLLPVSARNLAVLTYMEEHLPEEGNEIIDGYIGGRNRSFLDLAINRRSTGSVRYMLGRGLLTTDALEEYLMKSVYTGRVEITALLLEYGKDKASDGLDEDPFAVSGEFI